MQVVDLSKLGDDFVFHFGGEFHQIDAETFARTLLELSGALKEINRTVNPEFEVDIYIDSLGEGSFRARIKTITKNAAPLLGTVFLSVATSLLASFIYEKINTDNSEIKIIVNDSSYIVEQGNQRIVLPKEVGEFRKRVLENPVVEKRVSKAFEVLENDTDIIEFGITENLKDELPLFNLPRSDFGRLSEIRELTISEERRRVKDEAADLLIIRAIFERGTRKWQFVWRDEIKISAPILDETFFDKLVSHEYVIGTGDRLQVLLRIYQYKDEVSDVWINENYEVIEVRSHSVSNRQTDILSEG